MIPTSGRRTRKLAAVATSLARAFASALPDAGEAARTHLRIHCHREQPLPSSQSHSKGTKWLIIIVALLLSNVFLHLQIFVDGMYQHLSMPKEAVDRIFPFIDELIELHFKFLEQLRYRQKEQTVVDTIADILLEQFSGLAGNFNISVLYVSSWVHK